jgi:two-component system, response regulator YesN
MIVLYKVLIADDEYYIRDGLEHMIEWEEYGLEVVGSVENGVQALDVVKDKGPHIIVTDVKMPNMNGIELIKKIRQEYEHIKIIIISGYDDFEYVKESLLYGVENYILKPINEEELSNTLLNTVSKIEKEQDIPFKFTDRTNFIKENIFCRIVTNIISHEEMREKMDFLNINLTSDSYVVGMIKIITNQEANFLNINNTRKKLVRFLEDRLNKQMKSYVFRDLSGHVVILFCKSKDNPYSEVENSISKLLYPIKQKFKINIFVTMGSEQVEIAQAHKSYAHAQDLQKYIYIYPANTILSYPKVIYSLQKLSAGYQLKSDDLKEFILKEDKMGIENFFSKFKKQISISEIIMIDYVRDFIIELAAVLIGVAKEKEIWKETNAMNFKNIYNKLFNHDKFEDTINWLKDIACDVVDRISEKNNQFKPLIEEIVEYVNKHYTCNISLKTIAVKFYLNPSYLGQKFKNKTGRLFSDYLRNLRMEEAKKILTVRGMKASEVALKVGYNDPNYFYKVFKKYTGVYPAEYKISNT